MTIQRSIQIRHLVKILQPIFNYSLLKFQNIIQVPMDTRYFGIVNDVTRLLPNANVTILTDGDIHEGKIFKTNGTHLLSPPMAPDSGRAYGILILGHQEYVTQKEYDNLKNFVANGGTIIFIDANTFYAEVSYDKGSTNSNLDQRPWLCI